MFLFSLLFFLVSHLGIAAPTTDDVLIQVVKTRFQSGEVFRILEQAVNINSGTTNPEGTGQIAALYAQDLKTLGFRTWSEDMGSVKRGAHLFGEYRGANARNTILLIGHLDTVFPADSPFQKYAKRTADTAQGPGVLDMKSGNLVILEALRALHAAGELETLNVYVAFTVDEEDPGLDATGSDQHTRKTLVELAKKSDYALGFEPSFDAGIDRITVARRGVANWKLAIETTGGHSARLGREGVSDGAAYLVGEFIHALNSRWKAEPGLTINVGQLGVGLVGGKPNVIPSEAQASGDVRYLSLAQFEQTRSWMKETLEGLGGTAKVQLDFEQPSPAMAPSSGNHRLLSLTQAIHTKLGFNCATALDPNARGAADISYVAGHVKGALDGLGAAGGGAHSHDEWVRLGSIEESTLRATLLLRRLSSE